MKKQNEALEDKQGRIDKKRRQQNDQSSEGREERLAKKKRKNTNARRQLIREVESPLAKQVRLEKKTVEESF